MRVEQRHELDGVSLGHGLELVFERGLLVLLRDAHLAVGKDLGMQVARGGDEIHGIGQLGELDEIAKVDHEAQVVVIAQAVDVGGRAKTERA